MIARFTVTDDYIGKTVYTVLRHKFKFSASLIRRLKRSNGIFLNGEPVFTTRLLSSGDTVSADIISAEPPCDILPEHGSLDILFENEGLIAVNKPSGILVHPSRAKYTGTLANYVSGYLLSSTGYGICHAVNRLDRDTSGIVLFSKNAYMKDAASKSLSNSSSCKKYTAIVYGKFSSSSGTISLPIRRFEEGNMLRITAPDGKTAVTHYKVTASAKLENNYVSMLELILETGRTHQIRVHCQAIGHPLLGDVLYHTEESSKLSEKLHISAQTLHAHKLIFTEPCANMQLELTAPILRSDMKNIINML